MSIDERPHTRNLYVRQGKNRWHIVPPDPSAPGLLNQTTWCGRYRSLLHDHTTVQPKLNDLCRQCLAAGKTGKLRSPTI
jgi:hypothetical protein